MGWCKITPSHDWLMGWFICGCTTFSLKNIYICDRGIRFSDKDKVVRNYWPYSLVCYHVCIYVTISSHSWFWYHKTPPLNRNWPLNACECEVVVEVAHRCETMGRTPNDREHLLPSRQHPRRQGCTPATAPGRGENLGSEAVSQQGLGAQLSTEPHVQRQRRSRKDSSEAFRYQFASALEQSSRGSCQREARRTVFSLKGATIHTRKFWFCMPVDAFVVENSKRSNLENRKNLFCFSFRGPTRRQRTLCDLSLNFRQVTCMQSTTYLGEYRI